MNQDDVDTGVFTGIAEVELPKSFKLKNIQETEMNLYKLMEKRQQGYTAEQKAELRGKLAMASDISTGYAGRFLKPKSRADYIVEERRREELAAASAIAPSVELPPDMMDESQISEDVDGTTKDMKKGGEKDLGKNHLGMKVIKSNDQRLLSSYRKRTKLV